MADSALEDVDPLGLVGTLIDDRYKVERLIGRGGMGHVYAAEHVRIKRPVAIKVLSQITAQRRFEREAITTAKIDHPNSVRLSDFGQLEDGTLFLVMEYLVGTPLSDVIKQGPLETERALKICADVLAALEHAHKKGVVHRDIKPENIILCKDEDDNEIAKVLDFGIASLIRDATSGEPDDKLTEAGMAIGTPSYMSPEQGFGTDIDGRSDLYSTTAVLFEMLTGAPPFRGETPVDTLKQHISKKPPTLRSRSVQASAGLEKLIAKGLAKKAADRFDSAADYAEHIEALAPAPGSVSSSSGAVAAPTTAGPAFKMPALPKWWPIPIGAVGLVVVVWIAISAGSSGVEGSGAVDMPVSPLATTPDRPAPETTALARQGARLIAEGDARGAVELLTEVEADPTATVVLGHAWVAQKKRDKAIAAYKRAIETNDRVGDDPQLVANLASYVESRRRKDAEKALGALILAATPKENERARDALAKTASSHRNRTRRARAQEAAKLLGIRDLDWLSVHLLDLRQGKSCEERRKAVAKLRKLGDKKAIEPLRKAQRRMSGGVLGIGSSNINRCLADDAQEAVEYLEALY